MFIRTGCWLSGDQIFLRLRNIQFIILSHVEFQLQEARSKICRVRDLIGVVRLSDKLYRTTDGHGRSASLGNIRTAAATELTFEDNDVTIRGFRNFDSYLHTFYASL
jgi:hypothetical protein